MSLELSIINEFKRRVFAESYDRIFTCLDALNEDQIWEAPNKNCNSIGNLVLHLHGNAKQWMMTSFKKSEDNRIRSDEFMPINEKSKEELKGMLLSLKVDIMELLSSLVVEDLVKKYKVQVFEEDGISIFIHVIEHFSYHTGQITLLTKILVDKDLEFYPYSLD
jgi:uncharacterized damage-inducible protein DinB